MVNNRPFLPVAPATIDCVLQARIYLATKATPSSVKIHTRSLTTNPQLDRSPSVESILEYSQLQPYVHDVLITPFETPQTPANKYNARHSRRFGHYAGCVEKPANPREGESLPKSHSEAPAEGIQTCPGASLEEDRTVLQATIIDLVLNWNANKKIHIRTKEHLDWNNKIHVRTKERLNAIWPYLNTITATSRNNSSKFVRRNAFGGMPRCIQVVARKLLERLDVRLAQDLRIRNNSRKILKFVRFVSEYNSSNNSSKFIRWNAFGGMPRCIQVVARKLLERLDVRLDGILLYWNTIAARSVNS
ncbi:hypothetical protein B0H14DRAFT_2626331 [Mycena olivaceomarginata]|nr:hypothetical protein B0H14DRAFT_2626331 [Mycena olivaceomarginata]